MLEITTSQIVCFMSRQYFLNLFISDGWKCIFVYLIVWLITSYKIIGIFNSTMKDKLIKSKNSVKTNNFGRNKGISSNKQKNKAKKLGKTVKKQKDSQKRNIHQQSEIEYQYEDDLMFEQGDQQKVVQPQHEQQQKFLQYESPQDIKIRLAKQIISNVQKSRKKQTDDFFILQQDDQQQNFRKDHSLHSKIAKEQANTKIDKSKLGTNNSSMQDQQLKEEYFRSRNKLYKQYKGQSLKDFARISQPIEYKGHTKCITGIYLTKDTIFSCSKDRSIIKWDRELKKKDFISLGKDIEHHHGQILTLDFSQRNNILATAGQDWLIKLWDVRNFGLIGTLKSHRNSVNGIKFGGGNSENICSVSSDRTFKQWDIGQRSLMETFYGHKEQILDIDSLNQNDFISSGNDRSIVLWKTQKQTQMIFEGHDYAIDRIRAINDDKFITASQDGSVNIWSQKRKKPVYKHPKAHQGGWICSLDNIKQTNVFATGATKKLKLWAIRDKNENLDQQGKFGKNMNTIELIKEIQMEGIVTDIKINNQFLAAAQCDQHRLGRWITQKCRNKIKVFKLIS